MTQEIVGCYRLRNGSNRWLAALADRCLIYNRSDVSRDPREKIDHATRNWLVVAYRGRQLTLSVLMWVSSIFYKSPLRLALQHEVTARGRWNTTAILQ